MKETMIETFSPEETHALGKKIGQQAKPGDEIGRASCRERV